MHTIRLKDTEAFKAMAKQLLLAEAELAAYKAFAEAVLGASRHPDPDVIWLTVSDLEPPLRAELERLKS